MKNNKYHSPKRQTITGASTKNSLLQETINRRNTNSGLKVDKDLAEDFKHFKSVFSPTGKKNQKPSPIKKQLQTLQTSQNRNSLQTKLYNSNQKQMIKGEPKKETTPNRKTIATPSNHSKQTPLRSISQQHKEKTDLEKTKEGFISRNSNLIQDQKLIFKIQMETKFGEQVYIMGSTEELGNWTDLKCELTWTEGHIWTCKVNIPQRYFQYKYVVKRVDGCLTWESGLDRICDQGLSKLMIDEWQMFTVRFKIKNHGGKAIGISGDRQELANYIPGQDQLDVKFSNDFTGLLQQFQIEYKYFLKENTNDESNQKCSIKWERDPSRILTIQKPQNYCGQPQTKNSQQQQYFIVNGFIEKNDDYFKEEMKLYELRGENIWVGVYPRKAEDVLQLKHIGITGVLNLLDDYEMQQLNLQKNDFLKMFSEYEINFSKHLSLSSDNLFEDINSPQNIFLIAQYINDMINVKKLKIYIHSKDSLIRPPTAILAYLALFKKHKDYKDLNQLEMYIKQYYPMSQPDLKALKIVLMKYSDFQNQYTTPRSLKQREMNSGTKVQSLKQIQVSNLELEIKNSDPQLVEKQLQQISVQEKIIKQKNNQQNAKVTVIQLVESPDSKESSGEKYRSPNNLEKQLRLQKLAEEAARLIKNDIQVTISPSVQTFRKLQLTNLSEQRTLTKQKSQTLLEEEETTKPEDPYGSLIEISQTALQYIEIEEKCKEIFDYDKPQPIKFKVRKNSQLDEAINFFISFYNLKIPIVHIKDHLYLVGPNRYNFEFKADTLMIRVGGGFEPFGDFIQKNQQSFERCLVQHIINHKKDLKWVVNQLIQGKKISSIPKFTSGIRKSLDYGNSPLMNSEFSLNTLRYSKKNDSIKQTQYSPVSRYSSFRQSKLHSTITASEKAAITPFKQAKVTKRKSIDSSKNIFDQPSIQSQVIIESSDPESKIIQIQNNIKEEELKLQQILQQMDEQSVQEFEDFQRGVQKAPKGGMNDSKQRRKRKERI